VTTPALALAGLALGAAAAPHCVFMCGAPCAALAGGARRRGAAFHAGRLAGYMTGGAMAAASVSALGAWTRAAPLLQPLWTLVQLGFLGLGLWWLVAGRMPRRWTRDGPVPMPVRLVPRRRPALRAGLAGLAWVAWPCAALQGALLLAALADGAAGGALVMAAFALASAPGLAATPWLWHRLRRARTAAGSATGSGAAAAAPAARGLAPAAAYRMAGLALALSAGWALFRIVADRLSATCLT
jgi:sulfite exporter TauE/SafE